MPEVVVMGAVLRCPFGAAPGNLITTSQTRNLAEGKPAATVRDCQGNSNITPFAMCSSLQNPQVAAATAAALGVLTPQPCTVMTMGTWRQSNTKIQMDGIPALTRDATIMCSMGMGEITIASPGQTAVKCG